MCYQCEQIEMDYVGRHVARMEETQKHFRRKT
jgi:hypothetical protein